MNWYKIAQKNRGLYGNPQTDENRGTSQSLQERYQDNEIIEQKYIDNIRAYYKQGIESQNWNNFNNYIEKLREMGFSPKRIDSMTSRATIGKI